LVILHLTINDLLTDTINAAICQGSTYNLNGFNENQAGTYNKMLQTAEGCDSLITLHLTFNDLLTDTINATICQGSTYNLNGFNENQAGTYQKLFQTAEGCDSLVTLHLSFTDLLTDTINATICQGDTYLYNGQSLSPTEPFSTFNFPFTTISGCDSVVTVNITVNPVHTTTINETICEGDFYHFFGQNLTDSGTYTHSLTNQYGCDSIIKLMLKTNSIVITTLEASTCQDTFYYFGGKNLTVAGIYYDTLQSFIGCDSIIELTLSIDPLIPVFELTQTGILCDDDYVELTANIDNVDYLWNTKETIQRIRVSAEGTYSVQVRAGLCQSLVEIEVSCPCKMFLPNAFTPNGDGINDYFMQKHKVIIYDRLGVKIFEGKDGWDGTYNGKPAPNDTYYYVLYYIDDDGKEVKMTGSITVLR